MGAAELRDLVAILSDGHRQDAGDDAVRLLRAIAWRDEAEKASFWLALPVPLKRWISDEVKRTTTGRTVAS